MRNKDLTWILGRWRHRTGPGRTKVLSVGDSGFGDLPGGFSWNVGIRSEYRFRHLPAGSLPKLGIPGGGGARDFEIPSGARQISKLGSRNPLVWRHVFIQVGIHFRIPRGGQGFRDSMSEFRQPAGPVRNLGIPPPLIQIFREETFGRSRTSERRIPCLVYWGRMMSRSFSPGRQLFLVEPSKGGPSSEICQRALLGVTEPPALKDSEILR